MWRASPPSAVDCALLDHVRDKLDLRPLVIHVNYLINLASIDPDIRSKSIAAFRGELERAELIGAEYLVAHPGSYKNQTVADGIVNFAHGVAEASHGLKRKKVMLLIEMHRRWQRWSSGKPLRRTAFHPRFGWYAHRSTRRLLSRYLSSLFRGLRYTH